MPTYEIEANGKTYEVDAPDIDAASKAALSFGAQAPAATPDGPQGSAVRRFAGGVWQNINPVSIAKGIYSTVTDLPGTARAMVGTHAEQIDKAKQAWSEGRYSEALGHGGAAALPIIGPAAAAAGERIGEGDVAGGLGEGVGLLIPVAGARAVGGVTKAARAVAPGLVSRAAGALESGATARIADVMSPKVGANKARLGNLAEKNAPRLAEDLAKEGAPLTRGGFHAQIQAKLADAGAALDAAADARPQQNYLSQDILTALRKRRAELTVASPSSPGKRIVPGPNADRVAVLDQAIQEIQDAGPVLQYDPIRTLRQAYDTQAKPVYNPATTVDFAKNQAKARGAADVAGVLREELAKWDPATAKANAQYSLYKAADDVLKATAEVERVRPRVGRQIIARMTGTILGNQAGGVPGAAAGYVAGPLLDSALASGATTQLKTAAMMQRLADAIRAGDMGRAISISHQLKRAGVTATAVTGREVSGSSPRSGAPALATEEAIPR
jgi:hypothetical protein